MKLKFPTTVRSGALIVLLGLLGMCPSFAQVSMPKPSVGTIQRIVKMPSQFISARDVDVWLPPGYSNIQKFAVLYMQDGQMLFDANITWNKQAWHADDMAAKLMAEGKLKPFILVGIHNGGQNRSAEYFPQKPFESLTPAKQAELLMMNRAADVKLFASEVNSDRYLQYLVTELKPFIDSHYSVYTDAKHTAIMGSSMGGLISLYAISEYPQIFGSAACMSTHWPGKFDMNDNPIPDAFLNYMHIHLPDPHTHRIYFDHGTETLDAMYPPLQAKADKVMREKGYNAMNWQTQRFEGAEHSEKAWATRLDIPFLFLFGVVK